jgi:biliverdin reductase
MVSQIPKFPIGVGIVGTGYAARIRAEVFQADPRSHLIAVAGHTPHNTREFGHTFEIAVAKTWTDLIQEPAVDLVLIATVNRDHATIARAALEAGKHVVVEYPLALEVAEAEHLIQLAKAQQKLLHVEHIELLSGVHAAIATALPQIGTPFYVRYSNLNPQHPAPQKWTYQPDLFGFPLVGALSRIHRLTHLFGRVDRVSCQARYRGLTTGGDRYTSCLCTAQLQFANELVADVIYGKGEALWHGERTLVIQGELGAIVMDGEQGYLIRDGEHHPLEVGARQGLFAKDTTMVLNHLETGAPLYVTPESSLAALSVADAARRSAATGQPQHIL